MLIPFESGVQLRVPSESNFFSSELSPDGKLYAVASSYFLQIWSAGPELILLNQVPLQRAETVSADQLCRVFVVWESHSRRLAVVCGEGIVFLWEVDYKEYLYELNPKKSKTVYLPSCKLLALPRRVLDEYGDPLCVSSTPNSLLLGTATGNLVEIEWSGTARGYPISAPIKIFLPEVSRDLPETFKLCSIDYDPLLSILAAVVESGLTLLFRISYENRIYFNGCFDIHVANGRCLRMATRSHLLALAKADASVAVYSLQWANESLLPQTVFGFDVARYDELYPPPEQWTAAVTAMNWNRDNDHLAVCYGSRGLAVWNFQEGPVFWYSERSDAYCANCCCFSSLGDFCLFNGERKLVGQSFLRTNTVVSC